MHLEIVNLDKVIVRKLPNLKIDLKLLLEILNTVTLILPPSSELSISNKVKALSEEISDI